VVRSVAAAGDVAAEDRMMVVTDRVHARGRTLQAVVTRRMDSQRHDAAAAVADAAVGVVAAAVDVRRSTAVAAWHEGRGGNVCRLSVRSSYPQCT
jgi:hypothetical protein